MKELLNYLNIQGPKGHEAKTLLNIKFTSHVNEQVYEIPLSSFAYVKRIGESPSFEIKNYHFTFDNLFEPVIFLASGQRNLSSISSDKKPLEQLLAEAKRTSRPMEFTFSHPETRERIDSFKAKISNFNQRNSASFLIIRILFNTKANTKPRSLLLTQWKLS